MPPPAMLAAAAAAALASASAGISFTVASVIRIRAATEAADCSAVRVTLTGSFTPMAIMLPVVPLAKLMPSPFGRSLTLATTTEPS